MFIDGTLTALCTVGETDPRDSVDGGLVTLEIDVQNQDDETVLVYDHKVLVQSSSE